MKFMGYTRPDGCVGIRNHVVVLPGVLCAQVAAKKIVERVPGATFVYNHNGCGQPGSDTRDTLQVLSGLVANGNVYGALIVGLGCETTTKEMYMQAMTGRTNKPVYYIGIQEEGGVGRTVEAGVAIVEKLVREAEAQPREEIDLSRLILGLECGGSDPTSGISANTVLGDTSDRLLDAGGTAIISETSEAIGAEQILRDRARTPEIGEELYRMVADWDKMIYETSGVNVRSVNPSPGNKAGGLTTLTEKSLGCIHKSGTKPFEGRLEPGQTPGTCGLFYMNSTAYDCGSTTAKVAGGAHIIAFTTGLGNPMGSPVAPVLKITGNHQTAVKNEDMIDVDTSANLTGEKSIEELGEELLEQILRICNGEKTKAELNGADVVYVNSNFSCV